MLQPRRHDFELCVNDGMMYPPYKLRNFGPNTYFFSNKLFPVSESITASSRHKVSGPEASVKDLNFNDYDSKNVTVDIQAGSSH